MTSAGVFSRNADSVHLLQDMAQPQDTRNDMHSGRYCVRELPWYTAIMVDKESRWAS